MGFLNRRQRRWTWFGFLALAANTPVAAWATSDASWLFNIVVAGLVAFVLLVDEAESARYSRRMPPEGEL
ncbi:hypothetical protein Rhe02_64810 [Rhizocola hellebori]|uniref:Uncharacterized protein n=1 Tax=Rhizocola hellebori TaxID=1392758 RepID=A0A8J3QCU3_9ACTN|nr:hypothetical protein [Rhizocola hellebori]GIH08414.1 hypothetical protein Rhe02_64810 [Rhizocola hellebori]